MKKLLIVALFACILSVAAVAQMSSKGAAEEVIAITKAQWAAEMKKDAASAMKMLADDYSEFNPDAATRIEGKTMATRLSEAQASGSGSLVAAEMLNPRVQVYGDVAILSYNFVGVTKDKDGTTETFRAKSSRVYVKKDGQWWLVHANFGQDE